jgi:xanthine dehydrogenase accessory factor
MSTLADQRLIVLRGAGDLATGVAARLTQAGFAVVALELARPLTVRRTVSLSSAVFEHEITVENMRGVFVSSVEEAVAFSARSTKEAPMVPVIVAPSFDANEWPSNLFAVVDARLAKRNIDTTRIEQTVHGRPVFVIGLGPGFTAGEDVDVVIETNRGPDLGRVIEKGCAEPNTGIPGLVAGHSNDRVLRAPTNGTVTWSRKIGDVVEEAETIGRVGDSEITVPFRSVIRGLIHPSVAAWTGLKIGDIDSRCEPSLCHEISDKAFLIGDGVLRACQQRIG